MFNLVPVLRRSFLKCLEKVGVYHILYFLERALDVLI